MEKTSHTIPWPNRGDSLFNDRNDVRFNAFIGKMWSDWNLYADGYSQAVEYILNSFIRKKYRLHRDTIIYPILFLFHHNIELRIKNIVKKGEYLFDLERTKKSTHDLSKIWPNAKLIIKKLNKGADMTPLKTVDNIISELLSSS
jgi:hypothetical protein